MKCYLTLPLLFYSIFILVVYYIPLLKQTIYKQFITFYWRLLPFYNYLEIITKWIRGYHL